MKIAYLGAGAWGFALATLLAENGHDVVCWTSDPANASQLNETRKHPKLGSYLAPERVVFTSNMEEALNGAEMIVESVTAKGIRPVFEKIKTLIDVNCPLVLTSKGIEQESGLLLSQVVLEILGEEAKPFIGCLSGPSLADEVLRKLPTSVVCSAYDSNVVNVIQEAFSNLFFRVYPNSDMIGVSFGGAMKNIIAIACGISDGLGFGDNTKAALMTRGLHEIRKLAIAYGARPETLNGLSGMGDLCATCLSVLSRNYTFGKLMATGIQMEEAKKKIGMAVEGIYTCLSALQLGQKKGIPLPITEAVYGLVYEGLSPKDAAKSLLSRTIKEEHL